MMLPDNGSYRSFYDTGRPFVIWNVFAAPEFSLAPRTWCYPVAGCIAYRGYFSEKRARRYAARLEQRGSDVFVGGVRAYSTLGRFRDPLLNTMVPLTEIDFAGLIFHELAHQLLYVQDHSAFNEAFATAVEREGLRRWAAARGLTAPDRTAYDRRREQVRLLLRGVRAQLGAVYSSDVGDERKRIRKQAILAQLKADYGELEAVWRAGADAREQLRLPYAGLVRAGMNNASLAAVATYDNYVPAFERLLVAACGRDLACFYDAVRVMARMSRPAREARMAGILADALRIAAAKNPAGDSPAGF
jgi:predicted aminopeptidase